MFRIILFPLYVFANIRIGIELPYRETLESERAVYKCKANGSDCILTKLR